MNDFYYTPINKPIFSSLLFTSLSLIIFFVLALSPIASEFGTYWIILFAALPGIAIAKISQSAGKRYWTNAEKRIEDQIASNESTVGDPPQRQALAQALQEAALSGNIMIDKYIVGFDIQSGAALWLSDKEICNHVCVACNSHANKNACFGSLIVQQMSRARASGLTFIDAKSDSNTLDEIIVLALLCGRMEDLIIIDPVKPVHSYNFLLSNQSADVKAKKVLLASSNAGNFNSTQQQALSDSIYRIVRALESTSLSWTIKDIASIFSDFDSAYSYLKKVLTEHKSDQALFELDNFFSKMQNRQNATDSIQLKSIFSRISTELHAIAAGKLTNCLCATSTDLKLSDAISRGKIIYIRCPQSENKEDSKRWASIFRDDLEISIREINSSRSTSLDDPHLIFIDEESSDLSIDYSNLLDAAKDSQFSLLFGVSSAEPSKTNPLGLSPAFVRNILPKIANKLFLEMTDNINSEEISKSLKDAILLYTKQNAQSKAGDELEFDEEDFVSQQNQAVDFDFFAETEELDVNKESEQNSFHERKLAWIDLGNGNFLKGRYLSLEIEIPNSLNTRKLLLRFDKLSKEQGKVDVFRWIARQKKRLISSNNESLVKK